MLGSGRSPDGGRGSDGCTDSEEMQNHLAHSGDVTAEAGSTSYQDRWWSRSRRPNYNAMQRGAYTTAYETCVLESPEQVAKDFGRKIKRDIASC
jgi:hypothetical protein